ncbi:MAG: hypothetical protein PHP29_07325 [Tissierellia bacterium]|nr:hypothetical protein [Tissierellia bacterium]
MFCSIVPWFLLGVGFGKCSERRDVLGAGGRRSDPCCRRRR